MTSINFFIKNSIHFLLFLLITACQNDASPPKPVDIKALTLDVQTIKKVVPYIQKSKSRKATFSDFSKIQEDYEEVQKLWKEYEQTDKKMPQTLQQIDELTTDILMAIDAPLAELITKIKSSTVQQELIAWKKRQLVSASGQQKQKLEQDLHRLLTEQQKLLAANQLKNCDSKKFPRNATWEKVENHYRNCTSLHVERSDVLTIQQFVKLLKHTSQSNKALTWDEAHLIEKYYWRLEWCSECRTVDCYSCRKLIKFIKDAKKIAHAKDFQLT